MKSLLKNLVGVLAGLLFAAGACYAISGGPPYPVGKNLVGSYAGVLRPRACPIPFVTPVPLPVPSPTPGDLGANSIGVFTMGVRSEGLATGTFVFFAEGRVYNGTVQAVADAKGATVRGVINAREAVPNASATPGSSTANKANGNFDSRVIVTSAATFSLAGVRMRGHANLYLSPGATATDPQISSEICMKVNGFKQSNAAPAAVAAATP